MSNKKRDSRQYIVINEEKLISEVQQRPILYDKALKGYRKPTIREHAWQEVANHLESTGKFGLPFIVDDLFLCFRRRHSSSSKSCLYAFAFPAALHVDGFRSAPIQHTLVVAFRFTKIHSHIVNLYTIYSSFSRGKQKTMAQPPRCIHETIQAIFLR